MEPVGLINQRADEDKKSRMPFPSEDQTAWSLILTADKARMPFINKDQTSWDPALTTDNTRMPSPSEDRTAICQIVTAKRAMDEGTKTVTKINPAFAAGCPKGCPWGTDFRMFSYDWPWADSSADGK